MLEGFLIHSCYIAGFHLKLYLQLLSYAQKVMLSERSLFNADLVETTLKLLKMNGTKHLLTKVHLLGIVIQRCSSLVVP